MTKAFNTYNHGQDLNKLEKQGEITFTISDLPNFTRFNELWL